MFKSCRPDSTNKKPFGERVEGLFRFRNAARTRETNCAALTLGRRS